MLGDEVGSLSIAVDDIDELLDKDLDMHLDSSYKDTTTCAAKLDIPLNFRFSKIEGGNV